MSGNVDEGKGRVKKAVGELTGDDDMKRSGSMDKAAGKAKDAIDGAKDWAKDKMDKKGK
jgi:uncharacterized protein YjbJ (UPF0337 family)